MPIPILSLYKTSSGTGQRIQSPRIKIFSAFLVAAARQQVLIRYRVKERAAQICGFSLWMLVTQQNGEDMEDL